MVDRYFVCDDPVGMEVFPFIVVLGINFRAIEETDQNISLTEYRNDKESP